MFFSYHLASTFDGVVFRTIKDTTHTPTTL